MAKNQQYLEIFCIYILIRGSPELSKIRHAKQKQKESDVFWQKKLTLKVNFWPFLTTQHYALTKYNIFLRVCWFLTKNLSNILYPFNGNLKTQIAIMPGSKADLRKLVCTTMMKTVRSNPFKMKLPHPCFSAKTSTTFQRWNHFLSTTLSNWVDIVS